ncbi:MAG TPA: TolC family protein [Candidatus Avacidaminococcus intestinavium]|uniref:TolC family protein n=1 Tax=Candidatus Avacidaminococcus intestinavium TaxID=2840684 RepID=A0A9D1MNI5_9FIRM|nr:TolC family protein [Candidatus Avacidaminococcus intestinavium]
MFKYHKRKHLLMATVLAGLVSMQTAFAAPVEVTLDKAVSMALKTNPTVKISEAESEAAEGQKDAVKASRWFTINFNSDFSRGGYYDPVTNPVTNIPSKGLQDTYNNGFSASVPLYTGGKLSGTIEQAVQNYRASEYGVAEAYQAVKLSATDAFFTVLQTENVVALSQESVDRLKAHLNNVNAQYQVGVVAKVDVLRSEVELADAEQTLIKAQNAHDLAVANLNNIIGLPHESEIVVAEKLGYEEYTNALENCITFALANRPELYQAEASVESAKAGVKVARAGYLPQVSASASNKWSSHSWPGDDDENWGVGIGLSMNVFDSGVTAGKVKSAKATLLKAEETYRKTKDEIQLDVRNNYLNLREAEKRISTAQVAVLKAEEDYHIAQVRYQAGVGTNLDVMDSQVALTQAKNNYVQALYDYNTSGASLEKAMGVPVSVN